MTGGEVPRAANNRLIFVATLYENRPIAGWGGNGFGCWLNRSGHPATPQHQTGDTHQAQGSGGGFRHGGGK